MTPATSETVVPAAALRGGHALVDVETTGGNPAHDRIIEIAIVTVDDGAIVDEWCTLVDPGVRVPPSIEGLTGIDNDMLADAPAFAAVRDEVLERLRGRTLVAHNARFDYGFLRNEFRREGVTFRASVLCTVRLSRALYPEHRHHGLDVLIRRFGLPCDARHRALGDTRAMLAFIAAAADDRGAGAVGAAVEHQRAGPALPPGLPADTLDAIPDGPGVYLFYGEGDALLYVGKSTGIRGRVMSHFSGDHRSGSAARIAHRVRRVDWIETAGELGALLKEAELVKRLQPLHNRRLRDAGGQVIVALHEDAAGYLEPQILDTAAPDAWPGGKWYGPFGNRRAARHHLKRIAREHGLCPRRLGAEPGRPGRACFARQLGQCPGACTGEEPPVRFNLRLLEALGDKRIRPWPYDGPVALRERDPASGREAVHLVDRWRYLGTPEDDDALRTLLDRRAEIPFDRDHYRLLLPWLERHPEAARRIDTNAVASSSEPATLHLL